MPSASAPAFNPNYLDDVTITQALADGSHEPVLQAYFGASAYSELSHLARQALATPVNPCATYVYLLPGLLGSKLGRTHADQTELIWLDPAHVINGQLTQLTKGSDPTIHALDVMLPVSLKLALTLRTAGIPVKLYAYDWRCSVIQSGQQLARDISDDKHGEIQIVAHSMGGLVARAALKHSGMQKVSRIVQLGTPNHGSFALVQSLRACYPTVRKLGALDRYHSAEQLTTAVFNSFDSFYEMLPNPTFTLGINFYDQNQWPVDQFTPSNKQLKVNQYLSDHLAPADQRCHAIIGDGLSTITGAYKKDNEFIFQCSASGDGTVPVALAQWHGAQHWYIQEAHGQLPRNTLVCQAVIELLTKNTTELIRSQPQAVTTRSVEYTEADLKELADCKIRWDKLSLDERRNLLEPFISEDFKAACFK